jgi:hypothetical protein
MVASAWNVGRRPSEWKRDRLIEHAAHLQARTPSQRSARDLDLQIGATTVRTVVVMRGWHRATLFECPRGCGRAVEHVYLPPDGGEPGCRHCVRVGGERLDYSSRRINRDLPEVQRIERLRKLGAPSLAPFSEIGPRRKWQRQVTRLRLLKRLAEQEDRLGSLA